MHHKLLWSIRWAGAVAIDAALAIWLAAVAFALLGFRRTAEAIANVLYNILPVVGALLVISIAAVVVDWLSRSRPR